MVYIGLRDVLSYMKTILKKPSLYNLLYKDVKEDIELYKNLTMDFDTIVEYGAGTGRVTVPLVMLGKKVIAIDNEQKMLNNLENQVKKLKLENQVKIINANMIDYSQVNKEKCVIMPLTVFNYITDEKDQNTCLKNINSYLEANGNLILELLTKKTFMEVYNSKNPNKFIYVKNIDLNNGYYEYWRRTELDEQTMIITQERLFKFFNKEGKIINQEKYIWKNKFVTFEDIETKLINTGFKIDKAYGNCKMKPYNSDSEDLFIKAIKQ